MRLQFVRLKMESKATAHVRTRPHTKHVYRQEKQHREKKTDGSNVITLHRTNIAVNVRFNREDRSDFATVGQPSVDPMHGISSYICRPREYSVRQTVFASCSN